MLLLTALAGARADELEEDSEADRPCVVPCATCERKQDELWAIDERHLGCDAEEADVTASLRYQRYDTASEEWKPAKAEDFFEGKRAKLSTCYWVHGDRIDSCEAYNVGLTVYRRLVAQQCDAPPIRFVIWSWPTTQVYRRPLPDVRLKASRTPTAAFRLASVLVKVEGDVPVGLIGYSFGARVVTGALTLVSGGELDGRRLPKPPKPAEKYRAALLVSATDHDWLEPDQPHGRALNSVSAMLLVNNACDRILARYPLVDCGHHGPPALGYCGVASMAALGDQAKKVRQFDACCEVGKRHRWRLFIASDSIMAQVAELVLPKS